jgi:hypothetical protein
MRLQKAFCLPQNTELNPKGETMTVSPFFVRVVVKNMFLLEQLTGDISF